MAFPSARAYCEEVNRRRPDPEVHLVTGAPRALTDDMSSRMHKYLWSMGIRTVCFLLAVVFTGPLRWVFVAGAVVLPYVAVLIANAGREPNAPGPAEYVPTLPALTGPQDEPPRA